LKVYRIFNHNINLVITFVLTRKLQFYLVPHLAEKSLTFYTNGEFKSVVDH